MPVCHLLPEYHKALLNLTKHTTSVFGYPVSSHILFVDICIITGYFQSLQIKIKSIFHYIVTSCKCTSIQIRWTVAIKKSDVFVALPEVLQIQHHHQKQHRSDRRKEHPAMFLLQELLFLIQGKAEESVLHKHFLLLHRS